MQIHDHVDTALAAVGGKATWGGAVLTFMGWLLSSQGAALVGICGVVAGLAMNFYFSRKRDRREQAEHEMRMGAGK